jgi:hypothetical protein
MTREAPGTSGLAFAQNEWERHPVLDSTCSGDDRYGGELRNRRPCLRCVAACSSIATQCDRRSLVGGDGARDSPGIVPSGGGVVEVSGRDALDEPHAVVGAIEGDTVAAHLVGPHDEDHRGPEVHEHPAGVVERETERLGIVTETEAQKLADPNGAGVIHVRNVAAVGVSLA